MADQIMAFIRNQRLQTHSRRRALGNSRHRGKAPKEDVCGYVERGRAYEVVE